MNSVQTWKIWMMATALIFVAGCSSPKIVKSWKSPNLTGPIEFKKIAVIVIHPDKVIQRAGEDELVKLIGPDRAVAGYTLLSEDDRKDVKKVKAKVQASGVDGVVTMKVVGSRAETGYIPDVSDSFYNYYDRAGYIAPDPGHTVTDTIVSIQTNIYSVSEEKLIWSGVSETFNPNDVRKVVSDIAKAVRAELRKEKLIP